MSRPCARTGLIVERLASEVLVYDPATHVASCLREEVYAVLERCDGLRSEAELARLLGCPVSRIELAVDALWSAKLLVTSPRLRARRRAMSRLLVRAGMVAAVPAIWSVVAPSVAEAASKVMCVSSSAGNNGGCTQANAGQCCNLGLGAAGNCFNGGGGSYYCGAGGSCFGKMCSN